MAQNKIYRIFWATETLAEATDALRVELEALKAAVGQ